MPHPLISRSPDLQRLLDDGYEVEIRSGRFLLVHGIPYVTPSGEVDLGTLVATLQLAGDVTAPPNTHVVRFVGAPPHRAAGIPLTNVQHGTGDEELEPGLTVNQSFSCKPKGGYTDYYHLITTYEALLSGPAQALDPVVTARRYQRVESAPDESVFHYADNASSNAGIAAATDKLAVDAIAIVGLGGTGSYILDMVAKTPVREIHLFDDDTFLQHNAFRAPGAPGLADLRERQQKVDYLGRIYSRMHKGIRAHPVRITPENVGQLCSMSFVFVCVDDGPSRRLIADTLDGSQVAYVDVGMGVVRTEGALGGIIRTTTSTPAGREFRRLPGRLPVNQPPEDEYNTNIQIADLNALNASLAVIRWKKHAGFYRDLRQEHFSTYTTDCNLLLSDDPS